MRSWDEFIARQVMAQLRGEVMRSACGVWPYGSTVGRRAMRNNGGVKGPKDGMVWRYVFCHPEDRFGLHPHEVWYVNLTKKKVVDVEVP